MDLILRNARAIGAENALTDIGIAGGRIAAIEAGLAAEGATIDLGGRLVSPGFVETHIHLDKSCILDRVKSDKGDLDEAIAEAARAKRAFTPEDVHARAQRTLEKAILQGTTHMRTHVEVDPGVGLRGLEGVMPLIQEYSWAIDLQICVFPQEGLLNNPGTDELMVESLRRGCRAVGGAPYVDSDPHGQIDRIFELAREYDIDVDIHLDFGPTADGMDLEHVCKRTEEFRYGGRVAIGHVTKAASLPMPAFDAAAKRLAGAGVALTVLPSTDSSSWAAATRTTTMSRAASCPRTSSWVTASIARCRATISSIRSRLTAIARRCVWRTSTPISARSGKRPTCASASPW